jgi:hypothetical protein
LIVFEREKSPLKRIARLYRLPEDIGGPWGYGEMLEAIADPEHERHVEICEWLGEEYDPNAFDAAARQAEVASLAKRWSRRPPTKTPSAL